MYSVNPERGCGTKKNDAFYLEGPTGAGGILHAVTFLFGDGTRNDFLAVRFPPQGVFCINPAATIVEKVTVYYEPPYSPGNKTEQYERMLRSTKWVGVGDHIGETYYPTPVSFVGELGEYGPSRHVTRSSAAVYAYLIQRCGPIPILFTHNRVPLFRNRDERDTATELCRRLYPWMGVAKCHWTPCWEMEGWGQYHSWAKDQYDGGYHMMVPILEVLNKLYQKQHILKWEFTQEEKDAADFFETVDFVEQPVCLSWITRVSYTLPADGSLPNGVGDIPGLNIIDLDKED